MMNEQKWEKGWLDEILNQADQAVQDWPDWMRQPELRYPFHQTCDLSGANADLLTDMRRCKMTEKLIDIVRKIEETGLPNTCEFRFTKIAGFEMLCEAIERYIEKKFEEKENINQYEIKINANGNADWIQK
jgi:hypothetical protein